jgi:hypothetical protein
MGIAALKCLDGSGRVKAGWVTGNLAAANAPSAGWTNATISGVAATKLQGTIKNAQISGVATSKLQGTVTNAQVSGVAATKLQGTVGNTQLTNPYSLINWSWYIATPGAGLVFPIKAPVDMTVLAIEATGSTIGTSTTPQFDAHKVASPASSATSTNCMFGTGTKLIPATAYVPTTGTPTALAAVSSGQYVMVYLDRVGSNALTKAWVTVRAKARHTA